MTSQRCLRRVWSLMRQELITSFVDPEQWADNGGDLAFMKFVGGKLFVKAPPRETIEVVHRAAFEREAGGTSGCGVPGGEGVSPRRAGLRMTCCGRS